MCERGRSRLSMHMCVLSECHSIAALLFWSAFGQWVLAHVRDCLGAGDTNSPFPSLTCVTGRALYCFVRARHVRLPAPCTRRLCTSCVLSRTCAHDRRRAQRASAARLARAYHLCSGDLVPACRARVQRLFSLGRHASPYRPMLVVQLKTIVRYEPRRVQRLRRHLVPKRSPAVNASQSRCHVVVESAARLPLAYGFWGFGGLCGHSVDWLTRDVLTTRWGW